MYKNRGITLIALIITVIVMLILIGVTISIVLDGGLINKTLEAKTQTEQAQTDEQEMLDDIPSLIEGAVSAVPTSGASLEGELSNVVSGTYTLENNIYIYDSWTPIINFAGTLDGNGHTIIIENLNAAEGGTSGEYAVGLIHVLTGTVKNLNIVVKNITIPADSSTLYIGLIAAGNNGTIEGCSSNSNITINNSNNLGIMFGAIAALNGGTIQNCCNTGRISITLSNAINCSISGITVLNANMVQNCYNTGEITVESGGDSFCGGIVGSNGDVDEGIIQNCYNTGTISVTSTSTSEEAICGAGGITVINSCNADEEEGIVTGKGTIQNCYNTGTISAVLSNATSEAAICGAGGIAVMNDNSEGVITTIQNCYNIGNIYATGEIETVLSGSIIGFTEATNTLRNYYLVGTAASGIGDQETDGTGTVAKSQAEMVQQSSFITLLNTGFDSSPWELDTSNVNNGYPILSWQ